LSRKDARRGLPLHGGHDRQGHGLGLTTEGAGTRQALLRVLRPGRDPRTSSRPKEWADKYKGKFDGGWDKLREETIARQKGLGVIPADCRLTARHKEIPAWDDMPEALKPILRRQMEVYAGFLEYTDYHVGRLLDGMTKLGILDDTLVYYIIGDNGARPKAH
jgi:Arylsulfatase A and related enzymes